MPRKMKDVPPSYNHGMAVTGPMDGKFIKADLDRAYRATDPETAETTLYFFQSFHFGGRPETSLHFWLPDGVTIPEALERITSRYARHSAKAD